MKNIYNNTREMLEIYFESIGEKNLNLFKVLNGSIKKEKIMLKNGLI